MLKSLIPALLIAAAAAPSFAFAQGSALTRADVLADLARVEKAGYTPTASQYNYPSNVQAAEARTHQSKSLTASR